MFTLYKYFVAIRSLKKMKIYSDEGNINAAKLLIAAELKHKHIELLYAKPEGMIYCFSCIIAQAGVSVLKAGLCHYV